MKSLILTSFFVLAVLSYANAKETNIIFTQVDNIKTNISGTVTTDNIGSPIQAFLLEAGTDLSYSIRALVSPKYQTPVKNSQFSFPFVQKGSYFVGAYVDKNKNGVIDVGKEKFVFASSTEVRYGSQSLQVKLSLLKDAPTKIQLSDYPEDFPIYVEVRNLRDEVLYLQKVKPPNIKLYNLPYPVQISLVEDKNDDFRLTGSEQNDRRYKLLKRTPQRLKMNWARPWFPISIELNLQNFDQKLTLVCPEHSIVEDLPIQEEIFFYDLPPGEYQIKLKSKELKSEFVVHRFTHRTESKIQLDLSNDYKLILPSSEDNDFAVVYKDKNFLFQVPFQEKIPLYQPGVYRIITFRDGDQNKTLDPYGLANEEVKVYGNTILKSQASVQANSEYGARTQKVKGKYKLLSKAMKKGNIVFIQKTPLEGIFNTLQIIPFRKFKRKLKRKFYFELDPEQPFFSFFDLNENFKLDPMESKLVVAHDLDQLKEDESIISFPVLAVGELKILCSSATPDAIFVEITDGKGKESLAATFLKKEPVYLQQLPVGIDLKMKVIHDKNHNQELDDGDEVKPERTIRIDLEKLKKEVVVNL